MPQTLEEMAIALATKLAAPVHVDKFKGDLLAALSAARAQGLREINDIGVPMPEGLTEREQHCFWAGVMALRSEVNALLDSPSAAPERSADREWRPIETAPKDGKSFLAYYGRNDDGHAMVLVVSWCDYTQQYEPDYFSSDDLGLYPSRWMPLPEPPK